jgi:hypothetical protein
MLGCEAHQQAAGQSRWADSLCPLLNGPAACSEKFGETRRAPNLAREFAERAGHTDTRAGLDARRFEPGRCARTRGLGEALRADASRNARRSHLLRESLHEQSDRHREAIARPALQGPAGDAQTIAQSGGAAQGSGQVAERSAQRHGTAHHRSSWFLHDTTFRNSTRLIFAEASRLT